MPMNSVAADTPYFVLMDPSRRIGPTVVKLNLGIECSAVYGFSNKRSYDNFCNTSQQALTPYPLVKTYLREQANAPGEGLKLVVVDAAGPREPCLRAATMEAVLEAQENRTAQMTAAYRLTFDEEANSYTVEEASPETLTPNAKTNTSVKREG